LEVDVDGKMFCRRTVNLVPTQPAAHLRQGDPVKIRVLKNGASVEVQGKTRSAAKVGSTVAVETEAGAVFTGTLISPSVVEVKL
jgi:flagella basal body P-ring formation protein FlgA